MATHIKKISKDVYKVNNKEITLVGRVIPTHINLFLTAEEKRCLKNFLDAEDKNKIDN